MPRGAEQHDGMSVVAASMHFSARAEACSNVFSLFTASASMLARNPIASFPRLPACKVSTTPGFTQYPCYVQFVGFEFGGDDVGRARFLEGELWLLVNIAPQLGEARVIFDNLFYQVHWPFTL
jgi:hypothetical protein